MTQTNISTHQLHSEALQADRPKSVSYKPLFFCVILSTIWWYIPAPQGLEPNGWHILNIFVVTIIALIIKPLPMGASALLAACVAVITDLLTSKQVFAAFSSEVVWLVVFALFIAKGFNVTGLGQRIGYFFTMLFGKKTLGLSYGLLTTDLLLAPAIPSVTGRCAGIVFPILKSISNSYHSYPNCESADKVGGFLILTAFQVTVITSTMFMTAMAANPILASLALQENIELSWGSWLLGSIVPGIISLITIPLVIYKLYPPQIKHTPDAPKLAKQELEKLGNLKYPEVIMIFTVIVLLLLWIMGKQLGISAAVAAIVGLGILLVTGVLEWRSLVKIDTAWETFVWFCVLIMLAGYLKEFGVLAWFTTSVQGYFSGYSWKIAFPILALIYFYSHYLFASSTAHATSMFPAFLGLSLAAGTPPMLATLILVYFSSLFGGLTHYSLAPAPLLYGAGYVDIKSWWKVGFIVSLVNILIFVLIGSVWWKLLGLW